jgi:starvation-inducible DNA-binding protein
MQVTRETIAINTKAVDLASCLKVLLATVQDFAGRVQGAHWVVTGDDFAEYHRFFGKIYEDVAGSVDDLAENVRKLDQNPPFLLSELASMSALSARVEETDEPGETNDVETDSEELVAYLEKENREVLAQITTCIVAASKPEYQGILNFLADRQNMHMKWAWQLKASIEVEETNADE